MFKLLIYVTVEVYDWELLPSTRDEELLNSRCDGSAYESIHNCSETVIV